MSKNVTIQEGGVSKNLNNIKKLQVELQGGGSSYWVPEDEVQLTTKHISKNGTYRASDDNAYGYSQVTVSGVGKTSGIKPGSGTPVSQGGNGKDNEYGYTEDPDHPDEDGKPTIKETVLPSKIKIVGNPTKTEYVDGEAINKAGMVVKAYKNDGTLYDYEGYQAGAIPLSELTLDPTTASGGEIVEPTYEKDGVRAVELACDVHIDLPYTRDKYRYANYVAEENGFYFFFFRHTPGTALLTQYQGTIYCGTTDGEGFGGYVSRDEDGSSRYGGTPFTPGTAPANHFIRVNERGFTSDFLAKIPESTVDPTTIDFDGAVKQGDQKITVKWNRPVDQKELTDKFDITVTPAPPENQGGEGTGGGGGDSW